MTSHDQILVMGSGNSRSSWVLQKHPKYWYLTKPDWHGDTMSRRYFITRAKSPVGNWFEKDESLTREQQIEAFERHVRSEWMGRNQIPPGARRWLEARAAEVREGRSLDLVCNCRVYANQGSMNLPGYANGCHGETLADIIKLMANH